MTTVSGIYAIINEYNGRAYVGGSTNIYRRWSEHKSTLRFGTHRNELLQLDWSIFGEGTFSIKILENVPEADLKTREQHWINILHSNDIKRGYNIEYADGRHGLSTILKLTILNRKKAADPEFRKKLSDWQIGRSKSEEHRQALKDAVTPELRQLRAENAKRQWENNNIGRKKVVKGTATKGWYLSEETKAKMRKPKSEETKAKMRAARARQLAAKRGRV